MNTDMQIGVKKNFKPKNFHVFGKNFSSSIVKKKIAQMWIFPEILLFVDNKIVSHLSEPDVDT